MKKRIIVFLSIIIMILCVVRYYELNKNVPKEYTVDQYTTNKWIKMDDSEMIINSYKINQRDEKIDGDDNFDVTLNVTVKNISNNTINISDLLDYSKVSLEIYYQDYCNARGEGDKVENLKANSTVDLELKYTLFNSELSRLKNKDEYRFYIAKQLYKNEVEKFFKEGNLYSKYVILEERDFWKIIK